MDSENYLRIQICASRRRSFVEGTDADLDEKLWVKPLYLTQWPNRSLRLSEGNLAILT